LITRTWTKWISNPPRPRPSWLPAALSACLLGCSTLGDRGQSLVPTRYELQTGPFVIHSNVSIPADAPSVRCLQSLESDIAAKLDCQSRSTEDPIEIYILNDRNAFSHFLKFYYPELPPRRAFFLAQGSRRVVYTYLGPRLEEDLRHEATHALVRGFFGDLPLWLDEGLAEYFETGTDTLDDQQEHLARFPADLKGGWTPDLARLESLTDIHQMTPRDYRESWAWVHFMLSNAHPGKLVLLDYLKQSRDGPRTQTLSQLLAAHGTTNKALVAHLQTIQSRPLAAKPKPPEPEHLIRLQDRGPERPMVVFPAPRAGLLRRIGSWLGF
jgi:hypothetical protein